MSERSVLGAPGRTVILSKARPMLTVRRVSVGVALPLLAATPALANPFEPMRIMIEFVFALIQLLFSLAVMGAAAYVGVILYRDWRQKCAAKALASTPEAQKVAALESALTDSNKYMRLGLLSALAADREIAARFVSSIEQLAVYDAESEVRTRAGELARSLKAAR